MKGLDSFAVLMGIFRFSSDSKIPADGRAIQQALFKLSKKFPKTIDKNLFNENGYSFQFDTSFDQMVENGMLAISGLRFEYLIIDDKLIDYFDNNFYSLFSLDQINDLKKIGRKIVKKIRDNQSGRYKYLMSLDCLMG